MQARVAMLTVVSLFAAGFGHAQTGDAIESEQGTYSADFFAAAAPANALDMVLRLPGFTIVEPRKDVRGYAGAQGNVLIDGARPASKRNDIAELLKRIPASSIARIDLIRSSASGLEMAGYAVLANVVRKPVAICELAIEGGLNAATDGWIAPRGSVEYGRRQGDHALEFAASIGSELDDHTGSGQIIRRDPAGLVTDTLKSDNRTVDRDAEATTSWRGQIAGGDFAMHSDVRRTRSVADIENKSESGDRTVSVNEDEAENGAELGMRYVRKIGSRSTLDFIASEHRGWIDAGSRSIKEISEKRFDETTRTGERIVRIGLSREQTAQVTVAAGLEVASNFLASDTQLFRDGDLVTLPGSDIRIDERRSEGSLAATWRASDKWTLESGLRVEHSKLDQTGDSPLQRSFLYAKPRISALWQRNEREKWRASLSRDVGQLNFDDFVASASLDTGVVTAGNAQLEPDKTWRGTLAWERTFGVDGALGVTFLHDRIDDVIDRVAVFSADDVFDAPGNIGAGRRSKLSLDATSSLYATGLAGLHFTGSVYWQRSRVRDPTTGEMRSISKEIPVGATLSLVQVLPARALSWGVDLSLAEIKTRYGVDEISRKREAGTWKLFAEQRFGDAWRLRVELMDFGGRRYSEERSKFDELRDGSAPDELERRAHTYPGTLMLTLRRSMGG